MRLNRLLGIVALAVGCGGVAPVELDPAMGTGPPPTGPCVGDRCINMVMPSSIPRHPMAVPCMRAYCYGLVYPMGPFEPAEVAAAWGRPELTDELAARLPAINAAPSTERAAQLEALYGELVK